MVEPKEEVLGFVIYNFEEIIIKSLIFSTIMFFISSVLTNTSSLYIGGINIEYIQLCSYALTVLLAVNLLIIVTFLLYNLIFKFDILKNVVRKVKKEKDLESECFIKLDRFLQIHRMKYPLKIIKRKRIVKEYEKLLNSAEGSDDLENIIVNLTNKLIEIEI